MVKLWQVETLAERLAAKDEADGAEATTLVDEYAAYIVELQSLLRPYVLRRTKDELSQVQ